MPYAMIGLLGVLSLLSVKVPEGTDPLFFYGVSALVASVLAGFILFIIEHKNADKVVYVMGFVGVGLLLTLAVSIMPTH